MIMANLAPLPLPGLAILPQYLSNTPLKVILKGAAFSKSMTATTSDGRPLFKIESQSFSISHRRSVSDASTGQKLFEIRKEGMGTRSYFAEVSERGPRLFETYTHVKLFHRARTAVKFANQADPNRGMVELEFIPAAMGQDGSFNLSGGMVARVEKVSMTLSGEYHLSIAPGMDPALIVAVTVAMIDRAKTQAHAGAAGGAAAGSAGC